MSDELFRTTLSKQRNSRRNKILGLAGTAVTLTVAVILLAVLIPRSRAQGQQSASLIFVNGTYPSKILSLATWELQLPIAGSSGGVTVIAPPELDTSSNQFFHAANASVTSGIPSAANAVDFYTPPNGVTTPGTQSPRTELRQLNADGSLAAWSYKGSYAMQVKLAVELFPTNVASGGGVIVSQLFSTSVVNGPELAELLQERGSNANGSVNKQTLASSYATGTQMTVTLSVVKGNLTASIDIGTTVTTTIDLADDYYFKAGSYCQTDGSADTGCQVRMYSIELYGFPDALTFPP
ncbi:hypothetical protein HK100_000336 [Physocladia obscura]|uniref:Alginate lyase 2 domain-containing protein n=1 Tax=Physocladia obscura TaxID=109957 RepID=A0AAD5SYH3_9FUNG|nr:hypothetical protein HK100_000336 [Physocladia obscura]